ncbi:MAG: hypothetical protein WC679_00430 [Bacteroidales bacterium]
MGTFMWLVFATCVGLVIGFYVGHLVVGGVIGFFVGLLLKLITSGGFSGDGTGGFDMFDGFDGFDGD